MKSFRVKTQGAVAALRTSTPSPPGDGAPVLADYAIEQHIDQNF